MDPTTFIQPNLAQSAKADAIKYISSGVLLRRALQSLTDGRGILDGHAPQSLMDDGTVGREAS